MIKIAFRFSLLLTIGLLSVVGCDRDEVTEITNSQPIIDSVIVPEEIKAGDKVKLEVVAHDADGDELTYNWEVSEGTVDADGVWTVPAAATRATVSVHVSDGVNTSVASSQISVEIVLPPEPPSTLIERDGMVLIPAGEFQMGNNAPWASSDEGPVHTVYVDAFFIDKYEVTNLAYQKFILANPRWQKDRIDSRFDDEEDGEYLSYWNGNDYPKGEANHPVMSVNWYAAMAYAQWQEKRLPTEAEWEYAARGGLIGKEYPWGDDIDSSKANYGFHVGYPTPVGKYPPNGYGLYDMAGNLWEWCLDEYNRDFYANSPRENPLAGADTIDWLISNFASVTTQRVMRGGSWFNDSGNLDVYGRVNAFAWDANVLSGFRCVRAQ